MPLQYDLLLATRGAGPFKTAGGKFTPLLFGPAFNQYEVFITNLENKLLRIATIGGEHLTGMDRIKYVDRPEIWNLNSDIHIHRVGVCRLDEVGALEHMIPQPSFYVTWTHPTGGKPAHIWEGPAYGCVDFHNPVTFFSPNPPIPLAQFQENVYTIGDSLNEGTKTQ